MTVNQYGWNSYKLNTIYYYKLIQSTFSTVFKPETDKVNVKIEFAFDHLLDAYLPVRGSL